MTETLVGPEVAEVEEIFWSEQQPEYPAPTVDDDQAFRQAVYEGRYQPSWRQRDLAAAEAARLAAEARNWRLRGACSGVGVTDFYITDDHVFMGRNAPADRLEAEATAKAMCARCKVVSECLIFALGHEEKEEAFGIWGGLNAEERSNLRSKRSKR